MENAANSDRRAIAIILIRSGRTHEEWMKNKLRETLSPGPADRQAGRVCPGFCPVDPSKRPEGCGKIEVLDAAYSFGPFDYILIVRSPDMRYVEEFVVQCLRSHTNEVSDTQTLVGITIERLKESTRDIRAQVNQYSLSRE